MQGGGHEDPRHHCGQARRDHEMNIVSLESNFSDLFHFDADPDPHPRILSRDNGSGSDLNSNKFQFFS